MSTVETECPAEAVDPGDEILEGGEWCRVRRVSHVAKAQRVVIHFYSDSLGKVLEHIYREGDIVRVRSQG